jgi:hypothetical protein
MSKRLRICSILAPVVLCCCAFNLLAQDNPCDDPRYLQLKKKPLEQMTEREYDFFKARDAMCAQRALSATPALTRSDNSKKTVLKALSIPMITLGYLSLAGTVPFIVTAAAIDSYLALGIIPTGASAILFIPTGHILYARARSIEKESRLTSTDPVLEIGLTVDF